MYLRKSIPWTAVFALLLNACSERAPEALLNDACAANDSRCVDTAKLALNLMGDFLRDVFNPRTSTKTNPVMMSSPTACGPLSSGPTYRDFYSGDTIPNS
jgi:hypothetical protein